MRVKSMLAVGFLSMMVATGVVTTSNSVASDVQRVEVIERIGHGGSTYASSQSDGADTCHETGVSAIERMGHGGSTYSSSQSKSAQVGDCHVMGEEGRKVGATERIGAGGSTYSHSRSDIQTANR
jgi:hypothetical protein